MKTYLFYLDRVVSWTPRFRTITRKVAVVASSLGIAYSRVRVDYPDETISMFWPEYP